MLNRRRYYRIADITIQVESDLPMTDATYCSRLEQFRVNEPGDDIATIHHHFALPDVNVQHLGKELYRKPPWAIYRQGNTWVYLGILWQAGTTFHKVVMFNNDHTRADIYNHSDRMFLDGGLPSLTMFSSDQILVARLLADRMGYYLHSAGAILDGAGVLFVGQSGVGKSTTCRMLMEAGACNRQGAPRLQVEILCDDRNILRRSSGESDGVPCWRVYGTWSHGDVTVVSPSSAPLRAICFVEQAGENTLTPLTDQKQIICRLLECLIRAFVTPDWWNKTIDLIEQTAREVPCYVMRFDRSGAIVEELRRLIHAGK